MIPSPVNIIYEADVENVQPKQNKKACADKKPHIKRPLNAFMLWLRYRRKEISLVYPKLNACEITKKVSAEWKLLPKEEKQPFIDEAKRLREQHRRDHPEYVYRTSTVNNNPFLLWSRVRRREIASVYPKLLHSEITKQLCAEWKLLTIEEKQPFIDEAKRRKEQCMKDHPDYKCTYRHKQKSVVNTLKRPVVPHSMSSIFPPNFDAQDLRSNPPVSDHYTEQRSNPTTGFIPTYDMYSTTDPAISYDCNPQYRENRIFTSMTGHNARSRSVPCYQYEYMNSEQYACGSESDIIDSFYNTTSSSCYVNDRFPETQYDCGHELNISDYVQNNTSTSYFVQHSIPETQNEVSAFDLFVQKYQ